MQYTDNDDHSTESIKATTTPSDDDVNDNSPSEVSSHSDSTENIKANTTPSDGDVNDKTSTTPSEVSTYSTYATPVLNESGSQST